MEEGWLGVRSQKRTRGSQAKLGPESKLKALYDCTGCLCLKLFLPGAPSSSSSSFVKLFETVRLFMLEAATFKRKAAGRGGQRSDKKYTPPGKWDSHSDQLL